MRNTEWLRSTWKKVQHPYHQEVQIKTTLRFHLTPVRMAKIKNSGDSRCWRGCGERGTLLQFQRQSLELRQKERPSRDCPTRGSIPYTTTKPRSIAYASKILLTGPWHSSLLWVYANAWQIQKWMLTVIYWMEHRASMKELEKVPKELKGTATL